MRERERLSLSLSRGLILMEVSEWTGIVRSIQFAGGFDRADGFQHADLMRFDSLIFQQGF